MDVSGFLTSQVGYDLTDPKRALIRSYKRDYVSDSARYQVLPITGEGIPAEPALSGAVRYWGETWNAHWWEIDFSELEQPGDYSAVGNLQRICGLNAGITQGSLDGCVVWKAKVPEGHAVPYSQIYSVGRRWTGILGTVPNGFSVNPQFRLVVEPTREKDEPLLFTDEDWIPHGAGFVAGLTALRNRKRFE